MLKQGMLIKAEAWKNLSSPYLTNIWPDKMKRRSFDNLLGMIFQSMLFSVTFEIELDVDKRRYFAGKKGLFCPWEIYFSPS
jgi:hypothetical protein